jgi:DNA-binding transcriptional LysR family regulator
MEIRGLTYFRTVIDSGGVTRAAGLLHMTPGALSKALKRFEEDVGHKLLKRSGRNLVMTEIGKRLYGRSTRLLEEHDALLADLSSAASPHSTTLRIASFEPFTGSFMAEMLRAHAPDAEVEILELLVGNIERAILEARVDYGLSYVPFPNRDLAYRRVGRLEVAVFGAANAFLDVPFSELPFAVPVNRVQLASGERIGIDGWPSTRFPRNVKYRVVMMQSALELACRGMAVAVVPHFIAALHNATAKRSRRLVRWTNPTGIGRIYRHLHLICRDDERDELRTKELANMVKRTLTAVCAREVLHHSHS